MTIKPQEPSAAVTALVHEYKRQRWAGTNTRKLWRCVRAVAQENCDHNEMLERVRIGPFAWECASCGYVYGKTDRK